MYDWLNLTPSHKLPDWVGLRFLSSRPSSVACLAPWTTRSLLLFLALTIFLPIKFYSVTQYKRMLPSHHSAVRYVVLRVKVFYVVSTTVSSYCDEPCLVSTVSRVLQIHEYGRAFTIMHRDSWEYGF